jgi:hypothetical protein
MYLESIVGVIFYEDVSGVSPFFIADCTAHCAPIRFEISLSGVAEKE